MLAVVDIVCMTCAHLDIHTFLVLVLALFLEKLLDIGKLAFTVVAFGLIIVVFV